MRELKIGDRVAYYEGHTRYTGELFYLHDSGSWSVRLDKDGIAGCIAHPKQLRRLRKKERPKLREFWVTVPPGEVPNNDNILVFPSEKDVAEYNDGNDIPEDVIHVREVREPKERAK